MKHARSQAGNVFFLILLGVALFAAFSTAVMQTSQGSRSNPERDKLDATNIIKYGTILKGAVEQLRAQGISEADISFANNTISGYGTVDANPTAEVFNFDGGGIVYEEPLSRWLDSTYSAQTGYGEWSFVGSTHIRDVGSPIGSNCAATNCAELVAYLPYIKEAVCQQINAQMGVASAMTTPSANTDSSISFTKFTGTFAATDQVGDNPATGLFNGRLSGCIQGAGTPAADTYHYYQVLLAR